MTISLGNAIKSIKEDEKWITKILVLGIIFTIAQITMPYAFAFITNGTSPNILTLISLIIGLLFSIWTSGFIFSSINKTINSDKFQMAELNEFNLIIVGIKAIFATIGYGILTTIILTIAGLLYAIVAGIIGAIIFGILGAIIGFDNTVLSICISIFSTLLGTLFGLYIIQFVSIAFAFFIKRLNFCDFISFKKHFKVICENKHASWTLVGKCILYSLTILAIIIGLTVSIIGMLLIPFVIVAGNFVGYNLIVQYAKEVEIEKYM